MNNNFVELWHQCLKIIHDNVPENTYKTWFADIKPLKFEENTLTIGVPSQFVYEFIEENFVDLLRATLFKVMGEGVRLMYSVLTDKTNGLTVDLESMHHSVVPGYLPTSKNSNKAPNLYRSPAPQDLNPMLNTNYNFDNFVAGDSNKFPRTAAETVSENPGETSFNPLFIFGNSGVGKTHLANAIGTRIKELYPQKRVLYVSAHLFQVQYTDSIRNNTFNDFMNFYQSIDVLIIDDIQEFASLSKTQNTFFHIFNYLHQSRKQLVMTSDRSPVMLQGMEDRLITRFKWGLTAEIEKPDLTLRKDILRSKIRRDGLNFPEKVIEYIAENEIDSVRDLEGIVISIMAYSTIYDKDIDIELAENVVGKVIQRKQRTLSVADILEIVCKYFGIKADDVNTQSRKRELVQARQIAMYLSQKHTETSTAKIGKQIGNRDHATVLHACRIVKEQMEVDKQFRARIEEIEKLIKQK